MELLTSSIHINAPRELVWERMLNDATYREWTKAFNETSYFEGDWSPGSEIRFLGTDEDGNQQGMFSRIKQHIPHQLVEIEHIGMIQNGIIDTTSEQVKEWANSIERYTFTDLNGQTLLTVELDLDAAYIAMFEEMWEKALQILKSICESG